MNKIIYMGMAARLVSDKHHNLIIDLILKKKNFFINNNIKFLFAGDGVLFKPLKERVKKNNVNDIIYFSGYLNEQELIKWFKKLNIYIHLSKGETTSTSILQAMSMSLPIIASNVSGNRNLNKSKNGMRNIILVKNDIKNIYDNLKILVKNKRLQKKLGTFSRKIVIKNYSCEIMFRKYLKLINN